MQPKVSTSHNFICSHTREEILAQEKNIFDVKHLGLCKMALSYNPDFPDMLTVVSTDQHGRKHTRTVPYKMPEVAAPVIAPEVDLFVEESIPESVPEPEPAPEEESVPEEVIRVPVKLIPPAVVTAQQQPYKNKFRK